MALPEQPDKVDQELVDLVEPMEDDEFLTAMEELADALSAEGPTEES